ncbi:MAG: hypothetical protein IKR75_05485 [Fibrobacter sp.]|nr:hypothetical protein [Fibrobacter sp.]
MKKLFLLAASALLFACSDSDSGENTPERSVTQDMVPLLSAKKDFSKDTVIYLADSAKFVDKLIQIASFSDETPVELIYTAKAMASSIDIRLQVQPNSSGGSIFVSCNQNQDEKIVFNEPVFPAKSSKGFVLKYRDSLKVGKKIYYDILKFDASKSTQNLCNISKFYYGIHDGLVKVISKNGIELNRVSAKVYEDAEKRREEERARADSIAQAVADSIAQAKADSIAKAVADSILKANSISTEDSTNNTDAEIPEEIIDLAESVADCIKKAYSSGSLTAIKDCQL